jgi:hypothetical protein
MYIYRIKRQTKKNTTKQKSIKNKKNRDNTNKKKQKKNAHTHTQKNTKNLNVFPQFVKAHFVLCFLI